MAGAGISCFVMLMFEAPDAESVEGLQISRHGSATLQGRGSHRGSHASAERFRGRRSTLEVSILKFLKRIGLLKSNVWSTCVPFLTEVRFVF